MYKIDFGPIPPEFRFKVSLDTGLPTGPIAFYEVTDSGRECAVAFDFTSVEEACEALDKWKARLLQAQGFPPRKQPIGGYRV